MSGETLGLVNIKRLKIESVADAYVSDNTLTRILKHNNYYYLQPRNKDIMSRGDIITLFIFVLKLQHICFQGL